MSLRLRILSKELLVTDHCIFVNGD